MGEQGDGLDGDDDNGRLAFMSIMAATVLSAVLALLVNIYTPRFEHVPWLPGLLVIPLVGVLYSLELSRARPARLDHESPAGKALFSPNLRREARLWNERLLFRFGILVIGGIVAGALLAIILRWPFELAFAITRSLPGYPYRYWILPFALAALFVLTAVDRAEEISGTEIASMFLVAFAAGLFTLPLTGPEAEVRRLAEDAVPDGASGAQLLPASTEIAVHQLELFETRHAGFDFWEKEPRRDVEVTTLARLVARPDYFDGSVVAVTGKLLSVDGPLEEAGSDRATPYIAKVGTADGSATISVRLWRRDTEDPVCADSFVVVGLPVASFESPNGIVLFAIDAYCVVEGLARLPLTDGAQYAAVLTRFELEEVSPLEQTELLTAVHAVGKDLNAYISAETQSVVLVGRGPMTVGENRIPATADEIGGYCADAELDDLPGNLRLRCQAAPGDP